MLFQINPSDAVPIYHQLVRQVRDAIAVGRLKSGEKLPSQRQLALELVINHLTVKKAYEILESEGLIYTNRGRGTFVAEVGSRKELQKQGISELGNRMGENAATARILGMKKGDFVQLARSRWNKGETEGE